MAALCGLFYHCRWLDESMVANFLSFVEPPNARFLDGSDQVEKTTKYILRLQQTILAGHIEIVIILLKDSNPGREYWVECEKLRNKKWKIPEMDADLVRSLIPLNGHLVRALWAPLTSVVAPNVWYDPRDPQAEPDNDIVARMRELSYQIIIRLAKVGRIVSPTQTIGTHPQILVLKSTSTPRSEVQWPPFKFYGSDLSHLHDDSFRVLSLQADAATAMTALKHHVVQERLRDEADNNEAISKTQDSVEDEVTPANEDEVTTANEDEVTTANEDPSTQITESDSQDVELYATLDKWVPEFRPIHLGSEFTETGGSGTDPVTLATIMKTDRESAAEVRNVLLATANVLDDREFVTEESLIVATSGSTGLLDYVDDRLNREGAVLMQCIWYLKERLAKNAVKLEALRQKKEAVKAKMAFYDRFLEDLRKSESTLNSERQVVAKMEQDMARVELNTSPEKEDAASCDQSQVSALTTDDSGDADGPPPDSWTARLRELGAGSFVSSGSVGLGWKDFAQSKGV
jgi:cell division protein FtsB